MRLRHEYSPHDLDGGCSLSVTVSARSSWLFALLLTVGGCGSSPLPNTEIAVAPRSDATPAAVKVNGDVISIQQVNNLLQSTPQGRNADQQFQAAGQATMNLVDQQLLEQQAMAHKLDRDPEVQAAIETARGKILAEAYLKRDIFADISVKDSDAHAYYDANPALFAQRRIYALQEIDISAVPADKTSQLTSVVNGAKALPQVTQWLEQNKIEYTTKNGVRSAEQLPLALLPKLAQLKDGQMGVLQGEGTGTVIQLVRSEAKPVTFEQARPAIEHFIVNQQQHQRASAEVARLRQAATLEFLGDYAKYQSLSQAKPDASIPDPASGLGRP
jgi:EpsD family peptidyl-prolyl cis-trans isomerase